MLPALKSDAPSLADVLQSSLAAISGTPNRLGLPAVDSAVVVLIDGLGVEALRARAGHARTLVGALGRSDVIESGFPSTTASALATLTTGLPAGQHGLVGYSVLDPAHDRIVNQLSGWDERMDPLLWQPHPTLFETAATAGFDPVVIGPARYRDSGFTRAVLRGARYLPAASIGERMRLAAVEAGTAGRLIYVYVPELDKAGHAHGWQSAQWTAALETTDAAVRELAASLGKRTGLLVTADHGVLDVPPHSHVLVDRVPALVDGVRFVAGEPRALQLHLEPGADVDRLLTAWRESEGERAWIATRDEAIAAGWFGVVSPEVLPRIGDILVAARKGIAYYDGRAGSSGRAMIGQHGSWSPAELRVPLLRFGAY
jgi:hypothetical protein